MNQKKGILSSSKDMDGRDGDGRALIKVMDRPTFILKTREGENRAVSPSQRNGSKKESEHSNVSTKPLDVRAALAACPEMTKCIKFMDENMQLCDNPLDFLCDQQDFLVIGCVGTQGVGKSTIMSLLTSNSGSNIFPIQELTHQENGVNCTNGIDFFITKNRVIYLDTQPILSGSIVDHSISFEQKKNSTDFVINESNLELQSLQFVAFLYSVCHVIIFVQDWFVDPNLIRFLQAAEMLKPSSTTNMDQDYVEYYPHIVFLHNKASIQDFTPSNIEMMTDFYNKTFASSRLQIHSGVDMSSYPTENHLNLFLFPPILKNSDSMFYESKEELIVKLRRKLHGITRNAMTPSNLTEKNWYHYVIKVMEAIKKSHLSSEYGRLMP
ncbi:hypothetical protein QAD02_010091 [Eretmocerus hayati]|uniref:Uncharacterized protein n=1 Tax=Eretmocerus hayati TaxID=131215 RepID=A0ACC2NBU9_9HYME|nr:hypothetical protein QAD02_010091 [Eretmocerus hayati]